MLIRKFGPVKNKEFNAYSISDEEQLTYYFKHYLDIELLFLTDIRFGEYRSIGGTFKHFGWENYIVYHDDVPVAYADSIPEFFSGVHDADAVNHPKHYNDHPSGVECITIARHMGFNLGNVLKYIWRAGKKGPALEDLKKARFYLDDEIKRIEAGESSDGGPGDAAGIPG